MSGNLAYYVLLASKHLWSLRFIQQECIQLIKSDSGCNFIMLKINLFEVIAVESYIH